MPLFAYLSLLPLLLLMSACQSSRLVTDSANPQWVTYAGGRGAGAGKHIVLISGDEEYRSEEALPQLARILSERHGFRCTVLFAQDPARPGLIQPNYTRNIPGLDALKRADLMVLFTRFRDLPDEQMEHFERYLLAGKPVVAIRTATHAFEIRDTSSRWRPWSNGYNRAGAPWDGGFGRLVLGERWYTHHGHHKHQSTRGLIAPGAADHPLTRGLADGDIWGPTDVYGVRLPLPGDARPIVLGQVIDRAGAYDENDRLYGMRPTDTGVAARNPAAKNNYHPNDPLMPIAWTKSYQLPQGRRGQSFTSTIGSSTDMLSVGVRRLLVNAVYHLLDLEVPAAATVDLVGDYQPSAYGFKSDDYFVQRNLRVADFLPE